MTDLFEPTVTVHFVSATASHPLHPVKIDPIEGTAVSVTVVLMTKSLAHVVPHAMPPGLDVTVPRPIPAFVTDSVKRFNAKTAVAALLAVMPIVQVVPETESHPVQPTNVESVAGVAVMTTWELLTNNAEHSVPQLIPAGLDVTVPLPDLVTESVKRDSVNVAATDRLLVMVTVHVAPDAESQPVHPVKVESDPAAAVNVT